MSNRNGVWSLPAQYQAIADQDWTMAPGAPTGVSATAGNAQAEVSFTAPTFAGIPGTITQFKVTSSEGETATGSASPITVSSLTNGTAHTFTVQAQNAIGLGKASDASSSVTPLAEVISGLFSTFLYTGTGSSQTITNGINLSGKGGLVWIKRRVASSYDHNLFDTVRGATKWLKSNDTDAEGTRSTGLSAFNSNGFTEGGSGWTGENAKDYVSWTFRKEPKFFDVLTYTGNGTAGLTVNHNLGSVPGMIMVKATGLTSHWQVLHRNDGTNWKNLQLDQTGASGSEADYWGNGSSFVAPTSTAFTVGTGSNVNANGYTYIAYVFAHNNSDGGFGPDSEDIIKCGSYTGNGSSTGPSVNLGFEPQFVMIKSASGSEGWYVYDNMRGMIVGGDDAELAWNLTSEENGIQGTSAAILDPTPTGFNITNTSSTVNTSSHTYVYMAIRRPDQSVPTSASDVFFVDSGTAANNVLSTGFNPDMSIVGRTTGGSKYIGARLTGSSAYLFTDTTAAEASYPGWTWDESNQFKQGMYNANNVSWTWKRATGYFDVVAYTSNTTYPNTFAHNLGVVPEMIWIKRRDSTANWAVYHSALGNTKHLTLNSNAAESSSSYWNNTTPTASVVTVGGQDETWGYGSYTYIAYLFATVAGVSKVGSYDGNGSNQNIDCGFSNGAKFILIKSRQSGNWYLFDTARGIVAGNDGHLKLDTNDAEANADSIDTYSGGFNVVQNSTTDLNKGPSDESYIFYAIAA